MNLLADKKYLDERLNPQPGDTLYICLSDLLIAIRSLLPKSSSRVLDYGCGGSPYRVLFGDCTYHRADLAGGEGLDFEYGDDAVLPAHLSSYDCVLSTQVLEHVKDPMAYLEECRRVLAPGGHLLLTTHGIFEDHACPDDYWRWTSFGLRRMVEKAGFKVEELKKVTTGPRAVIFMNDRELWRMHFHGAGIYACVASFVVRAVRRLGRRRMHEACDDSFSQYRVVDAAEFGHDIYIGVALLASR